MRNPSLLLRYAVCSALVVILGSLPARAEDRVPAGFKAAPRAPKPFVAFTLADLDKHREHLVPGLRTPISAATPIRMKSGRPMTAAKFLERLNRWEQDNSSMGVSLRDPEQDLVLVEPKITRAQLQAQAAEVVKKHSKGPKLDPRRIERLKALHRRGWSVADLLALPPLRVKNRVLAKWDLPMGDANSLYLNLNGQLELNGTKDGSTVNGLAKVDCAIAGNSFVLAHLTASLNAPKAAYPTTASLELKLLGQSVYQLAETKTTVWETDPELSKSWTKSTPKFHMPFQVHVYRGSVDVWGQGTLGIRAYLGLSLGSAIARVTPFVDMKAYIELNALDYEVFRTGVGTEITLLHNDVVIEGIVQVQADPATNKLYAGLNYSVRNDMTALSGKLYAFFCFWCPCCSGGPFNCKYEKCWKYVFWDWDGFETHDYLISPKEVRVDLE